MDEAQLEVWREKLKSIQFSGKRPIKDPDKVLAKDMEAYKRLRKDGLQPPQVTGSAKLEGATEQMEITMGKLFKDKGDLEKARLGMRMAEDFGMGLK